MFRLRVMQVAFALVAGVAHAQTTQHVDLRFVATVGDTPFACGQLYPDVGRSRTTITPQDFRFFLSEVEVLRADGTAEKVQLDQDGIWQYKNLALLDFEDGTGGCQNGNAGLNAAIRGTVPQGKYTGVRFVLGVPMEMDHLDAAAAPAPLNTTAMFWSWRSGYKFLRLEVNPTVAKVAATTAMGQTPAPEAAARKRMPGFAMHLGSVGCVSTTATTGPAEECAAPNRVKVEFDHFDLQHDVVTADVAALLANTDLEPAAAQAGDKMMGPGCMSFPNTPKCVGAMKALGLPYGAATSTMQSFFRQTSARASVVAERPSAGVSESK